MMIKGKSKITKTARKEENRARISIEQKFKKVKI